jgi:hypothetical protein
MSRRRPEPKRRSSGTSGGFCSTPAQRAAQARIEQEEDSSNRALSDAFGFWRVCAKARCRRMRACAGVYDCFSNKWRQVRADDRFFIREVALAHERGADPERAVEIAHQKLAERDALSARFDAARAEHNVQATQRATSPQPRVRSL